METENGELLRLAHEWSAGRLTPVHPEIGRMLNRELVAAGEDAVPFSRATSLDAPSLADLVRAAHART